MELLARQLHLTKDVVLTGLVMLVTGTIWAQDYPSKTIRMVAQNPGGSGDTAARLIAPAISATLGQTL